MLSRSALKIPDYPCGFTLITSDLSSEYFPPMLRVSCSPAMPNLSPQTIISLLDAFVLYAHSTRRGHFTDHFLIRSRHLTRLISSRMLSRLTLKVPDYPGGFTLTADDRSSDTSPMLHLCVLSREAQHSTPDRPTQLLEIHGTPLPIL